MLDHLFIPQFCRDLLIGWDTTVTHRPVDVFPNGITCKPKRALTRMSIHGLWPNYWHGYPSCCNASHSLGNFPFDPMAFAKKYANLLIEMNRVWFDPTQDDAYDTLCEMYNHEFQKHGICYGVNEPIDSPTTLTDLAASYFYATLSISAHLENSTQIMEQWAANGNSPTVGEIVQLYARKVQVYCSQHGCFNCLSSVRTCWNEKRAQIDCPQAKAYGNLVPCAPSSSVHLHAYNPPEVVATEAP